MGRVRGRNGPCGVGRWTPSQEATVINSPYATLLHFTSFSHGPIAQRECLLNAPSTVAPSHVPQARSQHSLTAMFFIARDILERCGTHADPVEQDRVLEMADHGRRWEVSDVRLTVVYVRGAPRV